MRKRSSRRSNDLTSLGRLVAPLTFLIAILCFISAIVLSLPSVQERLAWRVDLWRSQIKYALNPPEEVVFVPSAPTANTPVGLNITPEASLTPTISSQEEHTQTETPTVTPTITLTPTPIPPQAKLSGFTHMYQSWNNCGPANLAMALTYWGWVGDQRDTAAYAKPNPRDKNVMPYEMAGYVGDETDLEVVVRVGGDLDMLKRFIAAGFPVIVEKGFEGSGFDGWMGHYEVVNGYDDAAQRFYVQDSYYGPDLPIGYLEMLDAWRAFNYTYLVIYPAERQAEVISILGTHSDPNYSYQAAAELALQETSSLSGRDMFFTWFNRGTNLVNLHDYTAAAIAYDAAFANYPSIAEAERPWRTMWYQTGPYFAYYYSQRYQDVIDLATTTLGAMGEPILEESYYWRGMARLAMGDNQGAIEDFQKSVEVHPGFVPGLEQLQKLGVEP